jgi:hypothetical protein
VRSITVRFSTKKALVATGLAAILGGSTYVLTAGNTISSARAGDGSSSISGYAVSNVAYVTDPAVPTDVDRVTFTLDANANTVKAKLVAASTTYTSCTKTTGTNWTCDFTPNISVTAADQLAVVATE